MVGCYVHATYELLVTGLGKDGGGGGGSLHFIHFILSDPWKLSSIDICLVMSFHPANKKTFPSF